MKTKKGSERAIIAIGDLLRELRKELVGGLDGACGCGSAITGVLTIALGTLSHWEEDIVKRGGGLNQVLQF